jgi:hypothetical protein
MSRLADAGMDAMDLVAQALRENGHITLDALTARSGTRRVCRSVAAAARSWKRCALPALPHIQTANSFAAAVDQEDPRACLAALLTHHEVEGGGLRWFVLRDGMIEPRAPLRGVSARYRFRLWPLARLAAQCGVLQHMPRGLRADHEAEETSRDE